MRPCSKLFYVLCVCLASLGLQAQGQINGPLKVCLGDISNFSYTPPSGLTLSSISWDFGDGNSSGNFTPAHTYNSIAKYTVRVQATFSNSSTASDSFKLEVFGLPKAHFYFLPSSDTCFNDHLVCYKDTSSPAKSGQTIVQRLMVWGDGTFQTWSSPVKGDSVCHRYPVSAAYTLRMEVTDKEGCKNSSGTTVNIVENITASFFLKDTFVNCTTKQIFMKNKSFGTPNSRAHYRWYVDTSALDTGLYFNNFKRVNYSSSRSGKVTLIAYANNACRDTMVQNFSFILDPLPTELTLSDTILCNSDNFAIESNYPEVARDSLCWYRDGFPPPVTPMPQTFTWFWNNAKLGIGTHEIKINIFRGSCVHSVRKNFVLTGPAAAIQLIDAAQCYGKREVYMVDASKGIDRNNCKFFWSVYDPSGDTCIKHVAKNINLYENCNRSRDWYLKHKFPFSRTTYDVVLYVQDTVNGCADMASAKVNMEYCSNILIPDTFHVCEGSSFKDNVSLPFPDSMSLDSGKSWLRFPSVLPSKYKGIYDIGFRFKSEVSPWAETIGKDSIKIHKDTMTYRDTIFRGQRIWVHNQKRDTLSYKVYGQCRPFRVTIFFKNGQFSKGDRLMVNWSDYGNFDSTFSSNTRVDSVMHYYNLRGLNHEIQVLIENQWLCQSVQRILIERGKSISMNTQKFINCHDKDVCFSPFVYEMIPKKFWSRNTAGNKVSWYFEGDNQSYSTFNVCHRFNSYGMQAYKLMVSDSLGCLDTLSDTVFIQRPRANLKKNGLIIFCSELKQFFDSSSYYVNPKYRTFFPVTYRDSVKRYSWRFGDNVYNSFQKNPVQSINTSLDSINASHVIEMISGCTDTIHFTIKSVGPKPYFSIRDTIGCGSLTATFINQSRFSKQYIWYFGDSANSQLQRFDKQNVQFTYNKPGRYHISLTGIDTVYNPFTNKYQACVSSFPDKLFQKDTTRSVLVLPFHKTGITGPDTVCSGTPVVFSSLSDTAYNGDYWYMGDSAEYDTIAPSSVLHRYMKDGTYKVKVRPYYTNSVAMLCRDSAEKTIVVMGVKADFDIDPQSVAPIFKLNNRSLPASAALNWDFGKSGPDNNSSEQNPTVSYGTDTGTYNICLVATIPYGCSDTVCKTVFNDYLSDFGIFNVFTPGKIDELNDKYDIQIEGESLYDLKIYNRWGVLVFESDKDADNTTEGNWNGKVFNTGEECPSGTYYYIFRYSLKSKPDVVETVEGVIQLIR